MTVQAVPSLLFRDAPERPVVAPGHPERAIGPVGRDRWAYDSRWLSAYPLVPLGGGGPPAPIVGRPGWVRYALPAIGWAVDWPLAAGRLPQRTPVVLDVWTAIVTAWVRAGRPASGAVVLQRRALWEHIVGEAVPGGGRTYRQVRDAVTYLTHAQFIVTEGETALGAGPPSAPAMALCAEATWHATRTRPGPDAPILSVRLTRAILGRLQSPDGVLSLDASLRTHLPAGLPRAMLRWLAGAWPGGGPLMVPTVELLARLGLREARGTPARVRARLAITLGHLRAYGVLRRPMDLVKTTRGWHGMLSVGDPRTALVDDTRLIPVLCAYGVAPAVAVRCATQHTVQTRRVIAALALGWLRPTKSLAACCVTYIERGWALPAQPPSPGTPEGPEARYLAARRTAAQAGAAAIRLDGVALRTAVQAQLTSADPWASAWVSDGLTVLALEVAVGVPARADWPAADRSGPVGPQARDRLITGW